MGKNRHIQNISELKKIKLKKEKTDAYALPYSKIIQQDAESTNSHEQQDEAVFMSAMRGVKKMEPSKGRQVPPLQVASFATPIDSEEEAKETLQRFIRGDIDFELEYNNDFMYGYVKGLDIKTFQQLKSGNLRIESHLDLHGMTVEQGQERTLCFVRESYLQGHRCILIVTGKGINSPGGQSVLRREAEIWLTHEPLKRVTLAFCTAQPKDGGAGAIYVLLRKNKKSQGDIPWDNILKPTAAI